MNQRSAIAAAAVAIVAVLACSNPPNAGLAPPGSGARAGMMNGTGGQTTTAMTPTPAPPSSAGTGKPPVPAVNGDGMVPSMPPPPSMMSNKGPGEAPVAPPMVPPPMVPPPSREAPPPRPLTPDGPGSSLLQPAEVCLPQGAMARVAQLACENGAAPTLLGRRNAGPRNDPPDNLPAEVWERMGDPEQPLEAGELDYHVIDRFELECDGDARSYYIDVYHCG